MQLFIILALLLYGGKSGAQNLINEVKPMLEAFGGEDVKEALKSAEEISSVLSAVSAFTAPQKTQEPTATVFSQHSDGNEHKNGFPLAPISNVANREITYSLSKYFENSY